jgi:hypothetical protein
MAKSFLAFLSLKEILRLGINFSQESGYVFFFVHRGDGAQQAHKSKMLG